MTWTLSLVPRPPISGTECRQLTVHNGKLFAGTGEWENTGQLVGPQIIRLDSDNNNWQLETIFPINPVNRIAVACLEELHFPTANLTTLVCGFFGGSAVGVKNSSGLWTVTRIGNGTGQIRSFIAHKDSTTGINMAFAGSNQGIFSGVYDSILPGEIQWASLPELNISGFPPLDGHPERVMSFCEVRGTLIATVGQRIYRRNDRVPATWTEVWNNPLPGKSQSGLRGATTLPNGNVLIGVEGTNGRVIEIDTTTWKVISSFDLSGSHNYYVIVAYNNFCITTAPDGTIMIIAGLDGRETGQAHYIVYNKGVWNRRVIPPLAKNPMVSCRTIIESPFNNTDIYLGGYDCNSKPCHNTEWVVKADKTSVLLGG